MATYGHIVGYTIDNSSFTFFLKISYCFYGALVPVGFLCKGQFPSNADLAPLGSPSRIASSGAGQRDYSVYTSTCETLESEERAKE